MATAGNVQELLSTIEFSTMDELIDGLFDKLFLAVAIFDSSSGILQNICMHAHRCKCYYMLLHGKPNQCSIFDHSFTNSIMSQYEVDMLCSYSCRLTMHHMDIGGVPHKVVVFQYNLDDDDLNFNSTCDSNYTALTKGCDTTAVDYFWRPNVLDRVERDLVFNFIRSSFEQVNNNFN